MVSIRRLRWGDSGRFYWVTSLLSARGRQKLTCRLLAVVTLGLGVLPIVMDRVGGFVAPGWRWVPPIVLTCSVAITGMWLRSRWPSKGLSQLAVLLTTGCIAAACLSVTDPLLGIMGCVTFVIPTVYISVFHSVRMLLVPWTVAATAMIVLAVRLSGPAIAVGLCSIALIVVVNGFLAVACATAISLVNPHDRRGDDIEHVTGLLTVTGFYEQVATLIGARSRATDRHLIVAVADLDSYSLLRSLAGAAGARQARVTTAQQLRETTRGQTVLAHVGETQFLLADLFATPDASVLLDRVRGAVTAPPAQVTVSIGAVSIPVRTLAGGANQDVLEEIRALAVTAMTQARAAGGNRVCQIIAPVLTTMGNDHPDDQ